MELYLILGVDQSASVADIKRAYRRLARRYHPGVNPGDRTAEAMFRRISEAYETLVDPGRRQAYDASGTWEASTTKPAPSLQFTEFDFSSAAYGAQAATFSELFAEVLHPLLAPDLGKPRAGADVQAAVTVDFLDAIRGADRRVIVVRQVACNTCGGRGQTLTREARCGQCQGSGSVRWARGHMVFSKPCPTCEGSGHLRAQRCAACSGNGWTVRSDAVPVTILPGTVDGDRLRVPERGHAGHNGGRNGDLYVTVRVQPHPFFRREGDDLICRLPVAVHEAVLGARVEVPTLDGRLRWRIPPGTQAGQRFRIKGQGVEGRNGMRGDLVLEASVVLPASVDERSKELMREFGERNQADVRKQLSAEC
jgi:molecular chaperone DnaJ